MVLLIQGIKSISRIIITLVLLLLFIISIQYYHTEIYKKQPSLPFSGNHFYNPYQDYLPNPVKANFHAHSTTHFKITNGAQSPVEIFKAYTDSGYQVASLSNYQSITNNPLTENYIPVYEHGFSISKYHQLIINAKSVSFFDFVLFQNHHQKQQILKRLKTNNNLVALAHPALNNAVTSNDLKYLRGYDLMEVYTGYSPTSRLWDAALSAGYPIWLLANDDTHNIYKPNDAFRRWNRIYSNESTKNGIVGALAKGCHYGVSNTGSANDINRLDSCTVNNGLVKVYFRQTADSIRFITDNGIVSKHIIKASEAEYSMLTTNTYVRIDAYTATESIILNPVIRYNGKKLRDNLDFPPVDLFKTALYRFLVLIVNTIIVIIILALNGKIRLVGKFPRVVVNVGRWKLAI